MKVLQNRTSQKILGIWPEHCVEVTSEQAVELEEAGLAVLVSGDPIPGKIFKLENYEAKAEEWEKAKAEKAAATAARIAREEAAARTAREVARLAEEEAERLRLEEEENTRNAKGVVPREISAEAIKAAEDLAASKKPGVAFEFKVKDPEIEVSPVSSEAKAVEVRAAVVSEPVEQTPEPKSVEIKPFVKKGPKMPVLAKKPKELK